MHFVDRYRPPPRINLASVMHVGGVGPRKPVGARDDRRGGWPQFSGEAERISLERLQRTVGGLDLELVNRAQADPGCENLPQSGVDTFSHWMTTAVPGVEVANRGYVSRVRRPDREMHAIDAIQRHR